jgi:hypothetical protein
MACQHHPREAGHVHDCTTNAASDLHHDPANERHPGGAKHPLPSCCCLRCCCTQQPGSLRLRGRFGGDMGRAASHQMSRQQACGAARRDAAMNLCNVAPSCCSHSAAGFPFHPWLRTAAPKGCGPPRVPPLQGELSRHPAPVAVQRPRGCLLQSQYKSANQRTQKLASCGTLAITLSRLAAAARPHGSLDRPAAGCVGAHEPAALLPGPPARDVLGDPGLAACRRFTLARTPRPGVRVGQ